MRLWALIDQFTLCGPLHPFDGQFSPQRGRLISNPFLIDKCYGPSAPSIFGSASRIVLLYPRRQIPCHAGVQALICAFDDVNVPHNYRHPEVQNSNPSISTRASHGTLVIDVPRFSRFSAEQRDIKLQFLEGIYQLFTHAVNRCFAPGYVIDIVQPVQLFCNRL
jgi:hypothetical protein